MTSPYLQRPKRSLQQAMRDTGRGLDGNAPAPNGSVAAPPVAKPGKGAFRLTGSRVVLGAVIGLLMLAGGLMLSIQDQFDPPTAQNQETLQDSDIVPASGPPDTDTTEQPPADIKDWGNAPELTPPTAD